MLVQLITAKGSVLCGAGEVLVLRGQGEEFSDDHLAERERERDRVAALSVQMLT